MLRQRTGATLTVTVSRGMKARRIAAITLLALSALWWMAFLVRDPYNDPRWLIHVGPPWVPRLQASLALPVVLTAAVGLACSRW